jgi:hypothetical protein
MANSTAHIRDNGMATLICPACGSIRQIAADKFRHRSHTITVRCICQQVFKILLDFRRHYRKNVSLTGSYEITRPGGVGGGLMQIHNISRGGLGFTISGQHRIAKDQELRIEFQLNDKKKTVLKKQVVVKAVQQNTVGCQFKCGDEMDKALGFFLRN